MRIARTSFAPKCSYGCSARSMACKKFQSVLNAGGSYRLTPRYDVLSAFHFLGTRSDQLSARAVKMAMGVRGSKAPHYLWSEIVPRHFEQMAKTLWPRRRDPPNDG